MKNASSLKNVFPLKSVLRMRNNEIVTTRYKIRVPHRDSGHVISIAVLADLHNDCFGKDNAGLVSAIEKAKADAVFSAGDLITVKAGMTHMKNAMRLIELLAKRWPVFLVNGNHEQRLKERPEAYPGIYEVYQRRIRRAGACLLDNSSQILSFSRGGSVLRVRVTGLSAELNRYDRIHPAAMKTEDVARLAGKQDYEGADFQILLAHHPYYFSAYADWGADLVLSGHLHGGMVRLPLLGGVVGGTLRPFPKYDRGLFRLENAGMAVSAGLGEHTLAFRINNPPELMVIDLYF